MDNSPLEECVQGWTQVVLIYLGGRRETEDLSISRTQREVAVQAEERVFTLQFNHSWELVLSSLVIFLVSKRLNISFCLEEGPYM